MLKRKVFVVFILILLISFVSLAAGNERVSYNNDKIIISSYDGGVTQFVWNGDLIKLKAVSDEANQYSEREYYNPDGTVAASVFDGGSSSSQIFYEYSNGELSAVRTNGITSIYSRSGSNLDIERKTLGVDYSSATLTLDSNRNPVEIIDPWIGDFSVMVSYLTGGSGISSISLGGSTVSYTFGSGNLALYKETDDGLRTTFYSSDGEYTGEQTLNDIFQQSGTGYNWNGFFFQDPVVWQNGKLSEDLYYTYQYDSDGQLSAQYLKGTNNRVYAIFDRNQNGGIIRTTFSSGDCEEYYPDASNPWKVDYYSVCGSGSPETYYPVGNEYTAYMSAGELANFGEFSTYTQNICGNYVIDGSDECDDGNTVSGDGCSSSCRFEEICEDAMYSTTNGSALRQVSGDLSANMNNVIANANNSKITSNFDNFVKNDIGWQCPPVNLQPGLVCKRRVDITPMNGYSPNGNNCGDEVIRIISLNYNGDFNVALANSAKVISNKTSEFVCDVGCEKKVQTGIMLINSSSIDIEFRMSCLNLTSQNWTISSEVYGIKSCNNV